MMSPILKARSRPGFVRLQIDITNRCFNTCVYCTRFIRHLRPDMLWEMDPAQLERIIDCSKDMPVTMFGIIGGEPQMHSRFGEIMEVCRDRLGYGRAALFTSIDPNKSRYRDEIRRTFHYIPANLHTIEQLYSCQHHPFTLAAVDMVSDPMLRSELIENCWIGDMWCFSASPLGIFHCEVAYGLAMLQGIKGWKIEPGWWKRETMLDQLYLCDLCGGCIPMEKQFLIDSVQKISPSFLAMLQKRNLPVGRFELVTQPFTIEYMANWAKVWRPSQYRAEDDEEAERQGAYLGNRIDWSKWTMRNEGGDVMSTADPYHLYGPPSEQGIRPGVASGIKHAKEEK
jgi:hypothetical protein